MSISPFTSRIACILITVFLFTLAFYNIFYGLSDFPIFSWDEARHGVSAYEMLKEGNLIVNTYKHKIDYWNLKPPLSFLITIAGYKLAGLNTLGLRIFSAASAFLTILIVFLFVNAKHGIIAAFISSVSLITSTQFLINHSARTADADSLFVLLFTSSILSLQLSEQKPKWLYISAITFSLAFLTKSWHAGNIFIIICLYLLLSGAYKRVSYKRLLLAAGCMAGPIIMWSIIRYQYDGIEFFKGMITYDLLKRSSTSIEGHIGSRLFYVDVLWRFSKFWLILLMSLILFCAARNLKRVKSVINSYTFGLLLWAFIPFILYSLAETKIRWYILPIYPVLSIFIGILGAAVLQNTRVMIKIALLSSILFISANYEKQISAYIHHPTQELHLSLVQKIRRIDDVKGFNLYIYRHTKNVWTQNTVLAAELYGDLKVKRGGLQAFLKSDKALLLLKKDAKTKQLIQSNHLKIITANKWGYIVCKPSDVSEKEKRF